MFYAYYYIGPNQIFESKEKLLLLGTENAIQGIYVERQKFRMATGKHKHLAIFDATLFQIEEYCQGNITKFTMPYHTFGSPFQQVVWHQLCQLPYGTTVSYTALASSIGHIKACRAVANALRRNPLLFVVPCHRVIGSNGTLKGYAAGIGIKERLLRLEHKRSSIP